MPLEFQMTIPTKVIKTLDASNIRTGNRYGDVAVGMRYFPKIQNGFRDLGLRSSQPHTTGRFR
jgi:hypothetical protein